MIVPRRYSFPDQLSHSIERVLEKKLNSSLRDTHALAKAITQLSDFYIANPNAATPWKETWAQKALLTYFLPLNFMRACAVIAEGKRLGFFNPYQRYLDFGSGPGTLSLAMDAMISKSQWERVHIECASEGHRFFEELSDVPTAGLRTLATLESWKGSIPELAFFSYAFTELDRFPLWAYECDALVVIEPATRDDGRRLLSLRADLIAKGFHLWAPCTHQSVCPLLKESKSDWCHDRVLWDMPEWFQKIEKELPMKNRTLTFSYLLASKRKPAFYHDQWVRVTGDAQTEKGKTRQMVCRGSEREFFSWLHRDFDKNSVPEIPRGTLLKDTFRGHPQKASEIRLNADTAYLNFE